jgi:hypothetical protein
VSVPPTGPADQLEAATVITIDLRAAASGPNAAAPGSIDERTLEERQRRSQNGGIDDPSGWRLINFERLLVVDDAAEFAGHEDDYRYLIEAPTFGRMLCLVIGAPADPPYLDLPKAMVAARVPVVWVGDSRGVGWRIGRANTTRLAFSDTDPDGITTVANLVESLTLPEVFDEIALATSDLPGRTGAPALLPWIPWTLCDPAPAEPVHQPEDIAVANPPANPARSRRWMAWLLIALCCVVIAVATWLAIRFGRHHVGYVVADAGCALVVVLVLLAIAYRIRKKRSAPVPPAPPEEKVPRAAASPSQEVLTRARWMMNVPVADEAFRQLSSPEQLVMLGGDPDQAKLVRFAPACARPLIQDAVDGGSISWTPAGDQLGVIRLVPIKAGLARQRGA